MLVHLVPINTKHLFMDTCVHNLNIPVPWTVVIKHTSMHTSTHTHPLVHMHKAGVYIPTSNYAHLNKQLSISVCSGNDCLHNLSIVFVHLIVKVKLKVCSLHQ